MNTKAASILGSTTQTMTSEHTGRDYRITISLPLGYSSSVDAGWTFHNTPEKWRTVYVLGGNWYFGMVADMIQPMSWCGATTDAIVVGIGYPQSDDPTEAFRETFTRRDHDLTPIVDEALAKEMEAQHKRPVPNGDAPNFHKFIQHELIPFIEGNYDADPTKRILVGHSYGGLFALFSLFETPDLFNSLIIGSPTLVYGDRFMFGREQAFADEHTKLPANVYLFVGDEEIVSINDTTLTDTLKLAALLESRKYEGFALHKRVFMDDNHCAVAVPGIHWGLKQALKKSG